MKFRFVLLGPDDDGRKLAPERSSVTRSRAVVRYEQRESSIVRVEQRENGDVKTTPLTNFCARIVRDIVLDDGDEQKRHFGLEVELGDATVVLSLSAADFSRMGWVLHKLGPQAIIYPGQQQHARAAIQWLSRKIRQERIFTHLGWTKDGPDWIYLHAGGAVGARPDVQTQLPAALEHFELRTPLGDSERAEAVRASLRFLSLAPDRISFPLLATVYRRPRWERWILAFSSRAKPARSRALWPPYASSTSEQRWMPPAFRRTSPRQPMRSRV